MKAKILLAAFVASLIVLPWLTFSNADDSHALTQAEIDQLIEERESQKQNPWLCMQIGWGC